MTTLLAYPIVSKQSCGNCYVSRPYEKAVNQPSVLRCCSQPPDATNRWPVVTDTDWCGHWSPKES